ncbi:MAG: SDR family NAD(P)-dependent oxidoreductase [Chloroflexi bacterium]|nr:SDR family NAD(P)-dependent oxidoreductase [Chloroflexota bacterium]
MFEDGSQPLEGQVAVVTGASRGIGRGAALALAAAGARVYVTGRSAEASIADAPGTLQDTLDQIEGGGGQCIVVPCDHAVDDQVAEAFGYILDDSERIDILVNAAWGGFEGITDQDHPWGAPFWQQPVYRWDAMFDSGVRTYFTASRWVAPRMIEQKSGLIVMLSYWAAQKYISNVPYGVAKAATDKMVQDMAHELRHHRVAVVSLYPGLVRTERMQTATQIFQMRNSESPEFTGRAIVALASDPDLLEKSGEFHVVAQLAQEYGFTDIDGNQPRPATIETS